MKVKFRDCRGNLLRDIKEMMKRKDGCALCSKFNRYPQRGPELNRFTA